MDEAGNEALREAIKHTHGVEATLLESVPVKEVFQGHVVWDGEVQVFEMVDHPTAKRAFAWSYATEGARRRFYTVLAAGPVTDAVTAVRAAIASDARRGGR
jgi:hypothetical protein